MIYYIIFIIIALVILIVLILTKKETLEKSAEEQDYEKRELLTKAETKFYKFLREIVPDNFIILMKTGLWAIIKSKKNWQKIAQKHLDFIIVRQDLSICAVIELDDSSHETKRAAERDEQKNLILKTAGIEIVRIKLAQNYEREKERIIEILKDKDPIDSKEKG